MIELHSNWSPHCVSFPVVLRTSFEGPVLTSTLASGDPKGISLTAEICEPDIVDKSGHYFIPEMVHGPIASDDLDYLRLKGVFSFPEKEICDNLIHSYFHYVHPFFPIMDVKTFLGRYKSQDINKIGVHLLWSMFLVASHVRNPVVYIDMI